MASVDDAPSRATPLSSAASLDAEALWKATQQLVDRLLGAIESEDALDACLDVLVDVLGADRGLLLLRGSDGAVLVANGRGRGRALSAAEREEASRTVVREAMEKRHCVQWDPLTAAPTSGSFVSLGIVSALAAPLFVAGSREHLRGALYVDFRDRRKFVSDRHIEFFATASLLVGAALEQHDRSQGMREQLREVQSHCMEARQTPPLADLLAFPSMRGIKAEIESALAADTPILITGESGTGKTLMAQAIAEASGRRPIVRAVLGASDDLNTITSELFGHERGSFSGAASKRMGLAEFADGGTLILDEILNLPPHAQQLLLDFTQFGTYRPLGYSRAEPKRARVRLIAATNGDLRAAIRERRFREDLYYRVAAVTLDLPPLRDRREDIPSLAESTLRRVDPGRSWTLSMPLRKLLVSAALDWSGNVRQLERAIERARQRAVVRDPEATVLTPEHLESRDVDHASIEQAQAQAQSATPESSDPIGIAWQKLQAERGRLDDMEKTMLRKALDASGGVVAQVARDIGIARTTLSSRMDALGLRDPKR
ncbi:MAG TPA: sigma 54-interacting transcriptional regulator [Polyangiaceae bacterium]